MRFAIDEEFLHHFRNLHQVFMYVTDECNLRCEQCIYKPNVTFDTLRHLDPDTAIALISDFRELGACKLTLLGGEPTLYGASERNRPLLDLITVARELDYAYVRIDTNGQFHSALLSEPAFQQLHEIAFSLDGFAPELNDAIRGQNTFKKCVSNLRKAADLGYKTTITCCVHRELCERDDSTAPKLHSMILFAQSLGAEVINFHDLFKVGVPMDSWTGDLNPSVREWLDVYHDIRTRIDSGAYRIKVRLPQCFVTKEEFSRSPEYYGYCPVKLGERVMVHADGIIRICSNLICTSWGVAKFFERRIAWDRTTGNEMRDHKLGQYTPCTNRSKNRTYGELVPVCFSFKPQQEEIVWAERLAWESRRRPTAMAHA